MSPYYNMSHKKNQKFENGLFIFRRDLRIVDNNGLHFLSKICNNVYTIFIFTPEQVGTSNKYKSNNSVQFMIESLISLEQDIRHANGNLHIFYGSNEKVIADCIRAFNINIVSFNLDVTPYAKKRDYEIVNMCKEMNIYVTYSQDYSLVDIGNVVNGAGEPYQKFTPYYETAKKIKVNLPEKSVTFTTHNKNPHISNKISLKQAMTKFTKINPTILLHGGRENALIQLKNGEKNIKHYSKTHNYLHMPTSLLSPYIKFGNISIREVYHKCKANHDFIRQLYWRDFYYQILFYYPHVFGRSLKPNYDKLKWIQNRPHLVAWCKGETGFPVIDAGMRQLNATGYMHNRARLLVASFLVKTLLIDWREGEKYFSSKLIDYDPANNNGNWQWISGGGADSQPYFRIFNPYRQSKEYDPDCEYIKEWLPELNDVPPADIHNWDVKYVIYKHISYPKPICDYEAQKEKSIHMYKKAFY